MRHIETVSFGGEPIVVYIDDDGFACAKRTAGEVHENELPGIFGKALVKIADERNRLQAEVHRYRERCAAGLLVEP